MGTSDSILILAYFEAKIKNEKVAPYTSMCFIFIMYQ